MGVLDTLVAALGLRRPIRARTPEPVTLGPGGVLRLDRLPAGVEIVVRTVAVDGGRVPEVREEPPPGPPFVAVRDGLWIHADDVDTSRGWILDFDGSGWRVSLALRVGHRETPNPDGRTYEVDRPIHQGRPSFFVRDAVAPPRLVRLLLALPEVRSVLLREHTLTIERAPGFPWRVVDQHVDAALHDHFLHGGAVVDGDAGPVRADPLESEVARVLEDEVLPGVHRDGGDIHLLRVEGGVAYVSLRGACASCPASVLTLKGAVERTLKRAFPGEIDRVIAE